MSKPGRRAKWCTIILVIRKPRNSTRKEIDLKSLFLSLFSTSQISASIIIPLSEPFNQYLPKFSTIQPKSNNNEFSRMTILSSTTLFSRNSWVRLSKYLLKSHMRKFDFIDKFMLNHTSFHHFWIFFMSLSLIFVGLETFTLLTEQSRTRLLYHFLPW